MTPLTDRSVALALLIATLLLASGVRSAENTLFYTAGHPDDWQLFMNPNAAFDVRYPNSRVVFIYMTAGDAGRGTGPYSSYQIVPYYLAREIGANAAVQFIATPERHIRAIPIRERVEINDRRIYRVLYLNTASYFLRLPDGYPLGNGPFGSLMRLYADDLTELADIESHPRRSNRYTAADLVETLRAIIRIEARGSSNVWANIHNQYGTPGDGTEGTDRDHADHIYSGRFMYDAIKAFSCINFAEFYGYQSQYMGANLTEAQLIVEAATWGATISGLLRTDGADNTFDDTHKAYLGRNWFHAYPGSGPCPEGTFEP